MKVLVINTVKFTVNGISTVIMNYYQNMEKKEIQFDFVVNEMIDKNYRAGIEQNEDRIFFLNNRKKNPFRYMRKLKEILKNGEYDIVHIHGNSSTMILELFAAKKYKKSVKIVHGHNVETDYIFLNKLIKPFFLKQYDQAFTASDKAGKWLYGNEDFTIIPNGVTLNNFLFNPTVRKNTRQELKLNDHDIAILHVGRFEDQKNHAFLIKVFKKIHNQDQNAKLFLVGTGSLINEVKETVEQLNLSKHVFFLGEQYDTSKYYQASDIFICPSLFESFGIVALEAQVSGLYTVVSEAIPEEVKILEDTIRLNLDLGPDLWAEKILSKYYSLNHIRTIDLEAFKEFDIKENAEFLKKLYEKYSNDNKKKGMNS